MEKSLLRVSRRAKLVMPQLQLALASPRQAIQKERSRSFDLAQDGRLWISWDLGKMSRLCVDGVVCVVHCTPEILCSWNE